MSLFASVGSLGTAAGPKVTNIGGLVLSWSPSRDVPVDHIVVLGVVTDSIFNIATDDEGARQDRVSIKDNAGNSWSMLAQATDTKCYFYCGTLVALFACQLTSPLLTTNVVNVYAGGVIDAKVASGWEFTIADGYGFAVFDARFKSAVDLMTDPRTATFSVSSAHDMLFLHLLGSEGPLTDSYTWDPDYTQFDPEGTTGGADDSNVTLRAGWRILTGTSDSVTVSNTTAGRDNTQVYGALTPVLKPRSFPRTPLLDDFNRADEEPLDQGGEWNMTTTAGPSSPGTRFAAVTDNQAGGGSTSAGGQFRSDIIECDDAEVWVTFSHYELGSFGIDVVLHGSGDTHGANAGGYSANFRGPQNAHSGEAFWTVRMGVLGNQGGVSSADVYIWLYESTPSSGWKIGIQRIRDFNHLWLDRGSGWQWAAALRTLRGDRPHSGALGLAIWDPLSLADDFGGGPNCNVINMNWRSASRYKTATRALLNPSDVRP